METKEKEIMPAMGEKPRMALILLMVFTVGGVFGFLYEEVFYWIDLGYLVKRGTTFGPWIPIYGFGAVLVMLAANPLRRNPAVVFSVSAIVCGVLEYITGFALFRIGGIRLWDYNTEIWNWGNVGGFICGRSVLFFGASALFLQYMVCPGFRWLRDHCSRNAYLLVSVIPASLFALDIAVSRIFQRIP